MLVPEESGASAEPGTGAGEALARPRLVPTCDRDADRGEPDQRLELLDRAERLQHRERALDVELGDVELAEVHARERQDRERTGAGGRRDLEELRRLRGLGRGRRGLAERAEDP